MMMDVSAPLWIGSKPLMLALVLILPDVLLLCRFRPGDAGTGHLERIENGIELLPGEQLVAQDELANRLPVRIASRAMRAAVS